MYKRRIKIFLAGIGTVMLVIAARLLQLQWLTEVDYREEISKRMRQDDVLPASRGHILDRQGAILAVDEPCFDLCVDYRLLYTWVGQDSDDLLKRAFWRRVVWWRRQQQKDLLAAMHLGVGKYTAPQLADLGEEVLARRLANTYRTLRDLAGTDFALMEKVRELVARVEYMRDASRHKNPREQFMAHPVIVGMDEATAVSVKSRLDDMVGVTVRPSFRRRYPYGEAACHIIGFTGQISPEELAKMTSGGEGDDDWRGDDIIGKRGVESMCEDVLRGRRGSRIRHRLTGEILAEQPAENGRDVHVTLDIVLQQELAGLFPPGATGCIVVLSVPRGEVLAMVSLPGFDLNTYRQEYPALASDEMYFPLRNRAVAELYPPGSAAKPIAALAGLGSGTITPQTVFTCTGYLDPREPNAFRCWTVSRGMSGHGPLDLVNAIKNSCNVYFYHVGGAMGGETIAEWYGMFGFTDPPGLGLPDERSGVVAARASLGDCRLMGIGQGPVGVTPVHVANAMATIARDGEFRTPVLVLEGGPAQQRRKLPLTQAQLDAVKLGMYKVCNERGGTAYKVFHGGEFLPLPVEVCGKTGTATVQPLKTADGRERRGDLAWFAGFGPYENPQIAFAVVVEYVQEGGGAANAGPIARETIRACVARGYIH